MSARRHRRLPPTVHRPPSTVHRLLPTAVGCRPGPTFRYSNNRPIKRQKHPRRSVTKWNGCHIWRGDRRAAAGGPGLSSPVPVPGGLQRSSPVHRWARTTPTGFVGPTGGPHTGPRHHDFMAMGHGRHPGSSGAASGRRPRAAPTPNGPPSATHAV